MKVLARLLLPVLLVIPAMPQEVLVYKHSIYWVNMNKVIFLTQYTDAQTSHNIISYLFADCNHQNFVVMERYEFIPTSRKILTIKPSNKIQNALYDSPERKAIDYVCQLFPN